jgi:uncharacterized SAM-binding protein YcdF (DUF218 family)
MFLFSKLFGILLNPMLWVACSMVLALSVKKPSLRRRSMWAALIMTLFFSNGWIVKNLVSLYSAKPAPMRPGESYEAGILLGGLAGYDKDSDAAYFTQDADRFIQALWLYRQGHIRRIVVSGGQGDPFVSHDFKEAEFLSSKLMEMGVPKEAVAWESASRNTIESARLTKGITDSMGLTGPFVLVTSAYHMPRASMIFGSEGFDVRPYPAFFLSKPSGDRFTWRSLIPNTNAMDMWRILLHELAGTAFARIKGA